MSTRRSFIARALGAASALSTAPLLAGLRGPASRVTPNSTSGFEPWLEIDATALVHNARAVALLSGGKPIIAVVKNNAYGLGLSTAGPLFDAMREVQALAVVRPDEALTLRKAGVRKPILLMGPASEEEMLDLVPRDVIQCPYRADAPTLLSRVATKLNRPVRIHLYVDTGMHRMGIPVADALPWIESLNATGKVRIEGAFTELVEDADFDRAQSARLRELQSAARTKGVTIGTLHAASSDAVMHQTTESYLDAVRPGLALYGGYVSERAMQRAELRPAYRLKARVIRLDKLSAGDGVSYHRRWSTDKPAWIATLGVGHVDGYPSGAIKGCEVMVRGRMFPVIGSVSASHTEILVGDERAMEVGDEATLVGPDHPALHPNEVARRATFSEYNMFMHLSPGLARRVVQG